jgi:hypothetical protein
MDQAVTEDMEQLGSTEKRVFPQIIRCGRPPMVFIHPTDVDVIRCGRTLMDKEANQSAAV